MFEGIYYGHKPNYYATTFQQFLKGIPVLGLTRSIAKKYALIRGNLAQKGQLIDQPDILIAATALHHNLTLVTRHLRDYDRISQLKFYQQVTQNTRL